MSLCRVLSCVVGSGCLLWPVQRSSIRVFANESSLPTGNPLQYSCLEIPWSEEPGGLLYIGSHRVGHNWSDSACMHTLEKEMSTHSSILTWRIPEPGGLPSIGSHSQTRLKRLSSSISSQQVAKVLELQLQHWSSSEYSGLIFFRIDWFDLLEVQGTLKSSPTPQLKSINSLAFSLLYGPTLISIHEYWKNHSSN